MIHYLDHLAHAPFPQQTGPGAAVAVPANFDPGAPLRLWIYFRGFGSCVTSIIGDADVPCSPGGRARGHSSLHSQLEASGANALLVLPELKREAQSGDPGALRSAAALESMVAEVLERLRGLVPGLSARGLSDVASLGVMSHSGGYTASSEVVRASPACLRSVVLLDSLYGQRSRFAAWLQSGPDRFAPGGPCRFASVYTGGTPGSESRALHGAVAPKLRAAGAAPLMDATTATLGPDAYAGHNVIFKLSGLSHGGVSRYYPEQFWRAGW